MSELLKKAGDLDLHSLLGTLALITFNFGENTVILGAEGLAMSRDIMITLAIEFEVAHKDTDWTEIEWEETVFKWVADRIEKEGIPHRKF